MCAFNVEFFRRSKIFYEQKNLKFNMVYYFFILRLNESLLGLFIDIVSSQRSNIIPRKRTPIKKMFV